MDFFTLVQKAKRKAITERNIKSAWKATGLIPFNPAAILGKLKNRIQPSEASAEAFFLHTPECQPSITIFKTPANVNQVGQIDQLIAQFRNQILDTSKLALVFKLIKGANEID